MMKWRWEVDCTNASAFFLFAADSFNFASFPRFPIESISALSRAVQCNRTLISASLNYCHLTHECGDLLGTMVVSSQIR